MSDTKTIDEPGTGTNANIPEPTKSSRLRRKKRLRRPNKNTSNKPLGVEQDQAQIISSDVVNSNVGLIIAKEGSSNASGQFLHSEESTNANISEKLLSSNKVKNRKKPQHNYEQNAGLEPDKDKHFLTKKNESQKANKDKSALNVSDSGKRRRKKAPLQEQNQENRNKSLLNAERREKKDRPVQKPKQKKRKSLEENDLSFQPHISEQEALEGVTNGKYIRGAIRINPNHSRIAFVTASDTIASDFYIRNLVDRNRAMNGDIVAVELLPESEMNGKTHVAKIVYIFEKVHPRTAVGYITYYPKRNKKVIRFIPRDRCFPILTINESPLINKYRSQLETTIFQVIMTNWITPKQADGEIIEVIGKDFELKAEQRAILLDNGIDIRPFPAKVLSELPKSFSILDKELSYRRDLRNECVFTIDPLTARDLDDALHIKHLSNGNYEVGVHISDVTYYLKEKSQLDKLVSKRATSTYLVDQVVHMLPPELCLGCSLLPHKDALSFSVIWELTPDGDIISKHFTRSIIFNCVQLAYEHAQWMIDHPDGTLPENLPQVVKYKPTDIRKCVLMLNSIARHLRKKRYDNGALKIGRVDIGFKFDSNGNPIEIVERKTGEANQMIEEFMLLANMSVAEKIYSAFPDMAFLRRHDPPKKTMLEELKAKLEVIGLHIEIETSAQLNASLKTLSTEDYFGQARSVAVNHLFAKPMTRAVYFNSAGLNYNDFHHFALSVPMYTHFTSPIRRYADVIVHRLLGASLDYNKPPNLSKENMNAVANTCNKMKHEAKRAGEASINLMLIKLIDDQQPFITDAVVVGVCENAFDAIILLTGTVVRVFMAKQDLHKRLRTTHESYGPNDKMHKMNVFLEENGTSVLVQIIDIFQIVQVALRRKGKTMTLEATWFGPKLMTNNFNQDELLALQMSTLSIAT